MLLKNLKLSNFRNYIEQDVEFKPGLNIILGANAQGKSNLLEAVEYLSTGRSYRSTHDVELISRGKNLASIAVQYFIDWDNRANLQNISIDFKSIQAEGKSKNPKLEKKVKINGATYSTTRNLKGSLCVVSFKSEDLNLARGGPKYRRDWIDNLLSSIDLGYRETSNRYNKCIIQRNRPLKTIAEKGGRYNLSDTDKEQLRAWSRQAASLGAKVTKERLKLLDRLRPLIEAYQEKISGKSEPITVRYFQTSSDEDPESTENFDQSEDQLGANWNETSESELESRLMGLYKSRFNEELARKQTLSGPHRDDIVFCLNDLPAKNYGSQGQTRTLVLSLKIAELDLVSDHLHEPPILLLDDVLAELDLNRQNFLMQEVANRSDMQTIITTTHIDAFQKNWLTGASFYEVVGGYIKEKISC